MKDPNEFIPKCTKNVGCGLENSITGIFSSFDKAKNWFGLVNCSTRVQGRKQIYINVKISEFIGKRKKVNMISQYKKLVRYQLIYFGLYFQ